MSLLRGHSIHSQVFAVCAYYCALENTIRSQSMTEEETDAFNTVEAEEKIVLMARYKLLLYLSSFASRLSFRLSFPEVASLSS